jgi:kynurenine formamidase
MEEVGVRFSLGPHMSKENKIVDLTHTLSPDIPCWDGDQCFGLKTPVDYKDCTVPNLFRVQRFEMRAGAGTHIDAPAHCIPGGKTVEMLKLENLIIDCVVINVDAKNESYVAGVETIIQFEKANGKIQPNTFVIFCTGWDKYWESPEKYRNNLSFPSVSEDVAKLLIERDIAGLGIDTLSADARSEDFPVHRVILGAGKYLIENIANAEVLPSTGAKIMIMPLKIKDATESPIRLAAVLP